MEDTGKGSMNNKKSIRFLLHILTLIVLWSTPVQAQENMDRGYYGLGVFAYEEGNFDQALKYFTTALESDPENPSILQFLGKTYYQLKRYEQALDYFKKSESYPPEPPDLQEDIADVEFSIGRYKAAAERYSRICEKKPDHIVALYRAGISLFKLERYTRALPFLQNAAEKNESIRNNARYFIAVCLYKTGYVDRSTSLFETVRDSSQDGILRANSEAWLKLIGKVQKTGKPYELFFNLSREYDDNVRLLPDDFDVAAFEKDWVTSAFLSGTYHFFNRRVFSVDAGYTHFQSWYDKLDDYNLSLSMPELSARYRRKSLTFKLSYLPAFYRVADKSYLNRQQIRSGVAWQSTGNISASLAYQFSDTDNKMDDGKDGQTHGILIRTDFTILSGKGLLWAELSVEDYDAVSAYESYRRLMASTGVNVGIFWNIDLGIGVRYRDKKYTDPNPFFDITRDDDRYGGFFTISRQIYFDWLSGRFTMDYAKNDSNILEYEYEKFVYGFGLSARF